jgi:DDE superfamily endonuclease
MQPGRPVRGDYEYERNGTANLFMMFAPLEGWRHVKVTERRTSIDYAHALKDLSDTHFPRAAKIILVQDNLNTHKPASLYEAFPPAEHGGWSNASRCIIRQNTAVGSIWPNPNSPCSQINASTAAFPISRCLSLRSRRGRKTATPTTPKPIGTFTTANARIKLKRLYPAL